MVKVGIFSAQGAVSEHASILKKTFNELGIEGEVVFVRKKEDMRFVDGIIIPGGESTIISKMLKKTGVGEEIKRRVKEENLPVMGTCAGSIVLAKIIEDKEERVETLSLMDMSVERNAFGRQRESFEASIDVVGFSKPFHAVFIRAPVISKTWGECKPLAILEDKIIAAKQGSLLALSFHPELTDDTRFHRLFLSFHYSD
ncbi:MAG: pyridoxal 5'-phosphate synthase glutaminase subunit PdxT [Thermoplasmata archaeon]|nr:pyridoxal 5'-phosphate synthase glutaminase subunit PdxT [Thermoplasmata archaeon]